MLILFLDYGALCSLRFKNQSLILNFTFLFCSPFSSSPDILRFHHIGFARRRKREATQLRGVPHPKAPL